MMQNTPPITRNIVILNILAFIIAEYLIPSLKYSLSVYMPTSPHFESWQVITHMFMHSSPMHLAFNMFTLWSFGSILERSVGEKRFILLYFLSGLGSFILFNFWNYYQVYEISKQLIASGVDVREIYQYASEYSLTELAPNDTQLSYDLRTYLSVPMLGASGAVFGVMAGFCTLYPDAKMFIMLIPFPIKAKYLLPVVIVVSAYLGIKQFSWDNVAHFAHIGGALVGYIMVKQWKNQAFNRS